MTLPATAGVEGIGVVIATAKNVPTLKDGALEVKDWVWFRLLHPGGDHERP